MIAQFAPDAPSTLSAAALALHIAGGVVAIPAGWVAMTAKKGGRAHRLAGTLFLVAMLVMGGMIVVMAPMLAEKRWGNAIGGILTIYLVLTGWHAARRPAGQTGRFEALAMAAPLGIIALMAAVLVGLLPAEGGTGKVIATGIMAALLARADWSVIRSGGLRGGRRLARHLWRLGAAFFAANGSFFIGQTEHVPEPLKVAGVNYLIPLVGVGLTVFWLLRVLRPRAPRPAAA